MKITKYQNGWTEKRLSRSIMVVALFLCTATLLGTDSDRFRVSFDADENEAQAERSYEQRRAAAHSRMPSTLYASNPSLPVSPHGTGTSTEVVKGINPKLYRNVLEMAHSRRSTTNSDDEETAESVFIKHISQIVQDKCVGCHVDSGIYPGDKLVFVTDETEDHQSHNFQVFADFIPIAEDGANTVLKKIRGENHGGNVQVPADSEGYGHFEKFLRLLEGQNSSDSGTVTAATVFDGVGFRSDRKTLRQAAVIFAGRVPTEEEYMSIGTIGLRGAIRNLMSGPGFHDFLIRASNDRLLTDRENRAVSSNDSRPQVDYINKMVEFCEAESTGASKSPRRRWDYAVQYGAVRAPLELIAHVVENDLPYTEILEADYVMANPQAAEAYGADTEFDNAEDPFEFKASEFTRYYLYDDSRVYRDPPPNSDCQHFILDPGNLTLDYPHAGILNTPVFMIRYPTTATNRNRARSRWTYYHFLGFDIEMSANRTTDADALADTNNPTLYNPACTICHTIMDPVAGTYQNYDDEGHYRAYDGGMNSLDGSYKRNPPGGHEFLIEAGSYDDRESVSSEGYLPAGRSMVGLRYEFLGDWSHAGVAQVVVTDSAGRQVSSQNLVDMEGLQCGDRDGDGFRLSPWCVLGIPVSVPIGGLYQVEVEAWNWDHNGQYPGRLKVWVPGYIYEEGDTWYRDMLTPGFDDLHAPSDDNSVQWLAQQIVEDDRFAKATVKFWWPALHGSEISTSPPSRDDADYEGLEVAAIAQDLEVTRLADAFQAGINGGEPYNLKDLLVEMVLSDWFRAETMPDDDPVRSVALLNAGAKRLLTPEELTSKTLALTGVQWGRYWRQPRHRPRDVLDTLNRSLKVLYGGIDSDGITERARDLTAVMASVAKSHAVELSCPIVLRELYMLPDDRRRLFDGIDVSATPVSEFSGEFDIEANSYRSREVLSMTGPLSTGRVTVNMVFTNNDGGNGGDRNIHLYQLRLRDEDGSPMGTISLKNLEPPQSNGGDCGAANSYNGETRQNDNFNLHSSCDEPLVADLHIRSDGIYTIEIVAWADQYGDELANLRVAVESDTTVSAGSRSIREKLTDLYKVLLDEDVIIDSRDIDDAYDFFVDVWNRMSDLEGNRVTDDFVCDWRTDGYFLEGFISDYLIETEHGYDWNYPLTNDFINNLDLPDPRGIGRTWTLVLMSMLMDQRYLHL